MNSHNITVLPFRPENQSEVKDLVLAGLAEHWGMLDPARNPDLDDIEHTYADAVFLVAWQKGRVVGTGALVPRTDDTGEIVRMSVAADVRRQGIGRMILQRLCERARSKGYKRLVLETTETWTEVIEFYKNFGFQASHHRDGDVYFSLEL
jgi:putative acetyltransferase